MLSVQGFRAQTAAVLHDVLEDTDLGPSDLVDAGIPPDIIATVLALTHRPEQTYEQYIGEVAANRVARIVKLADLTDNLANNRRLTRSPDVLARIARYQRAIDRLQKSRPSRPGSPR
jgi:hypothetical protein